MDLSQNALARALGVPPRRVNEIVLGKRAITADTALRLAKAFGTSEGFWLGLQADYDLEEARKTMGRALAQTLNGLQPSRLIGARVSAPITTHSF